MIRTLTAAVVFFAAAAAGAADAPPSSGSSSPAALVPLTANTPVPAGTTEDKTPPKPFVYTPKDSDIVSGKDSAPVTIVEYASLSCPHCSHFFLHALPDLTAKYITPGKVKLVFRNFPLNAPALKAAELVQCVEPSRRHSYIKVLFSSQTKWAYDAAYREALSNIAVYGGMDRLQFESCMNNNAIEKTVLSVAKEASDDYKVNSTPTFYINGVEYKGDREVSAMSKVIDEELAKAATK